MLKKQTFVRPLQAQPSLFYLVVSAIFLVFLWFMAHYTINFDDFPGAWNIHLRHPIDAFKGWVIGNRATHPLFAWFFDPFSHVIDFSLRRVEAFLLWLPWLVIIVSVFLLGQKAAGWRVALLAAGSLLFMGLVGLWDESMQTLALMGVSVAISLLVGIPLGILAARHDKFEATLRPFLDAMQTMPAFVYLIPVLLFFGVARVPSVVATVIYAIPPAIRLTNLGLRQVSPEVVEAARAFGSTPRQLLFKVQLPLAMPAIMAGVNQTIMMALGIVVIAALIGAGGLGRSVLLALQRLEVGQGLEAGLAIVFMAILLDRISDAFTSVDHTSQAKQWSTFHLLPESWSRFSLVHATEALLARLFHFGRRATQAMTTGVASFIRLVLRAAGKRDAAEAAHAFLPRHAFLVASLLLIIAFWVISVAAGFDDFPRSWRLLLRDPVDSAVAWMRDNLYQIGGLPIGTGPLSDFLTIHVLTPLRYFLQEWLPWPVFVLAVAMAALAVSGWRLAFISAAGLIFMGLLGMWELSMDTLSQVIVAVVLAVVIALPLGIWASGNDTVETLLRPILDTLQTIPPFVYLVPVIMLFSVGRVPGIVASILYALPPAIRLTNLGIRQVDAEVIEAAQAYGSTARQILLKVQLPLAMPAIMLGINQTVMMVLSMVIIAGLVGGGGLGLETVIGLARNETGRGVEAGLAIVIMAIIMDRITQAWANRQKQAAHL